MVCNFTPVVIISLLLFPQCQFEVTESTKNACQFQKTVEEEREVCREVPYEELYTKTCWAFWQLFRCQDTRTRYRTECKTELAQVRKTVWNCCEGYYSDETDPNLCSPVCDSGCVYGSCLMPNECVCDPGYGGSNCSSSCETGFFGSNCDEECSCENDATCNPVDGSCLCKPGFQGTTCSEVCDEWKHGEQCESTCECVRNQTDECDHATGQCICKPGYQDPICSTLCPEGTTGLGCNETCPCQNNGTCLPANGGCNCATGFQGAVCADTCDAGTWGQNCAEVCPVCYNGGECDRFNGTCQCPAGFVGDQCQQECEFDFWGDGCLNTCDCAFNATCNFRDGSCECNQFQSGPRCEVLSCPSGKYGSSCEMDCLCEQNSTCDAFDGSCTCLAEGYTGIYCSEQCLYGSYGVNCSETCNCSSEDNERENWFCHFQRGCLEIRSETVIQSEETGMAPALVVVITSLVILVLVAVLLGGGFYARKYRRDKMLAKQQSPIRFTNSQEGIDNPVFLGDSLKPHELEKPHLYCNESQLQKNTRPKNLPPENNIYSEPYTQPPFVPPLPPPQLPVREGNLEAVKSNNPFALDMENLEISQYDLEPTLNSRLSSFGATSNVYCEPDSIASSAQKIRSRKNSEIDSKYGNQHDYEQVYDSAPSSTISQSDKAYGSAGSVVYHQTEPVSDYGNSND